MNKNTRQCPKCGHAEGHMRCPECHGQPDDRMRQVVERPDWAIWPEGIATGGLAALQSDDSPADTA